MATRKNLLESLRKEKGCTLSQEQIAIRMGLPADYNRYDGSRHDDIINNFETRKTYSWDVLHYFRYCNVIGCDPSEPFVRLYPDEPYSRKLLNREEKEQKMKDHSRKIPMIKPGSDYTNGFPEKMANDFINRVILETDDTTETEGWVRIVGRDRNKTPLETKENVCVFGTPTTMVNFSFILPEICSAMEKGRNIFLMAGNGVLIEDIRNIAHKTGHKVYVYPYDMDSDKPSHTNYMSFIREPEAISLLTDIIINARDPEKNEDNGDAYRDILEGLLRAYIWAHQSVSEDDDRTLERICEYIKSLPTEEIYKRKEGKYPKELIARLTTEMVATIHYLSYIDKEDGDKLTEVFRDKHVIIYDTSFAPYRMNDLNGSILFAEYVRIINNRKEYTDSWKDDREYEVIIQNIPSLLLTENQIKQGLDLIFSRKDVKLVMNLVSIEELSDRYPDTWEQIMDSFGFFYITDFQNDLRYSIKTNYYIEKMVNDVPEQKMKDELKKEAEELGYKSVEELSNNPQCIRDCYIAKDGTFKVVIDPVYTIKTRKEFPGLR